MWLAGARLHHLTRACHVSGGHANSDAQACHISGGHAISVGKGIPNYQNGFAA